MALILLRDFADEQRGRSPKAAI